MVKDEKGKKIVNILDLQINNDRFEKEIEKLLAKEQKRKKFNSDWRQIPILKIQKMFQGINAFLIISLPLILLGVFFFGLSASIFNDASLNDPDFDVIFFVILYLTLSSLIITLSYQLVRRNLQNKIETELKMFLHEDIISLLKI